jgi:hypothetical protein
MVYAAAGRGERREGPPNVVIPAAASLETNGAPPPSARLAEPNRTEPSTVEPSAPANTSPTSGVIPTAAQPIPTGNTPATPAPSNGTKAQPKTLASAKAKSAMDERLDWLERDLKEKPAQPAPKQRRLEFPAIGLGAEQ